MPLAADRSVLRELAQQYAAIAADPVQEERRELWRRIQSLQPARPAVLINYGMWNVWCREVFGDGQMQCEDAFCREMERQLRMLIFHAEIGDDRVFEPWFSLGAVRARGWNDIWGLAARFIDSHTEGGAWQFDPVISDPDDVEKLSPPPHQIDEAATRQRLDLANELIGDLLPIDLDRNPVCLGFSADISTHLARLRGLEQLMLDMYERPAWLHRLLAFMRDGIIANQSAAEAAGDLSLTGSSNQAMPYVDGLPAPTPNARPSTRQQLWAFAAAQEFTGISPAMHDEFMLQYQLPIMQHFGYSAYGCCEDLTRKIDMLRQIPNLRRIAVTPRANLASSVEQIQREYVISWRPNPADMVCCGFNREAIRRTIGDGLKTARGCHMDITLKDIETVEGEPRRLHEWVQIVRQEIETHWTA